MYRSYSINDMPQPMKSYAPARASDCASGESGIQPKHEEKRGFLDNLKTDDIILIVVVLLLLIDDCDDKILLLALGFIFLTDMF